MKKRNKIIVSTLVLFLVMAVGYAIFAQTLKINGTANANGKLDLTYECFDKEEYGGTGTCKIEDDKSVTTKSTLKKPYDSVNYLIKITNTGSIPAVLKSVTSPNNALNDNLEKLGDEIYIDINTLLGAGYRVYREVDSDGSVTGDAIYGDAAVVNANITLQPGESIAVEVAHGWLNSNDVGLEQQPELPEGGASISYNLSFEFQQVTE